MFNQESAQLLEQYLARSRKRLAENRSSAGLRLPINETWTFHDASSQLEDKLYPANEVHASLDWKGVAIMDDVTLNSDDSQVCQK